MSKSKNRSIVKNTDTMIMERWKKPALTKDSKDEAIYEFITWYTIQNYSLIQQFRAESDQKEIRDGLTDKELLDMSIKLMGEKLKTVLEMDESVDDILKNLAGSTFELCKEILVSKDRFTE